MRNSEKDYYAVLNVYGLTDMKSRERKRLSKWLAKLAIELERDHAEYSLNFRAKLMK